MINLDDIVVKIKTDLSEFNTKAAGDGLDGLQAKGQSAGKGIGAVNAALGNSNSQLSSFASGLKNVTGAVDTLSRSQINVIRALENGVVATKLSGQSLAEYTALRKAGTAADSEAGIIIRGLVAAQYTGVAATSTWRNLWGLLGSSVSASNGAMNASALAARGVATEHEAASNATKLFRETTHTLEPVLNAAGASVGAFGGFVSASRAGVAGLAVAITGSLIIALAKAGDEAITTQKRLSDLVGNKQAGSDLFLGLETSAKNLGVSVGTLTAPMETVLKLMQDQNRIAGVIYAPGTNSAADFTGGVKTLQSGLESLGAFLRSDISDSTRLSTVLNSTLGSFAETGYLTKKTFDALRDASPATANAIATAFKASSATDFAAKVDGLRIGIGQFLQVLARLGPESQAALASAESSAGTTGLALDQAGQAAGRLWKSLSVDPGVKTGLNEVTSAIDFLADHTNLAKVAILAIGGGLLLAFGGLPLAAIGIVAGALILFANDIKPVLAAIQGLIDKWNEWLVVGGRSPQQAQNINSSAINGALGGAAAGATYGMLGGPGGVIGGAIVGGVVGAGLGAGIGVINNPNPTPDYIGGGVTTNGQYYSPYLDGSSLQQISDSGMTSSYATGTDQIIPPGHPGDSFRASLNLTSGERLIVVPAGKTLGQHLGGSAPIHLGNFADGTDMTVGSSGVDAMLTPQGGALASMVSKFSDTFDSLGISLKDAKETISAAGNNKLNDVVREGNIQLISAITLAKQDIVAAISADTNAVAGSISSLASTMQSVAASQAASNAAASNSSAAATSAGGGGGGGGGFKAAPNGGINGSDPLGLGALSKALGATDAGPVAPQPAVKPYVRPNDVADPNGQTLTSKAIYAGSGDTGPPALRDANTPSVTSGVNAMTSGGYDYSTSPVYGATGNAYSVADLGGQDNSIYFATPGTLLPRKGVVPPGNDNDGLRATVRLSSNEQFEVKRQGSTSGGSDSGSQSGNPAGITIGTVIINNPQDGPSVIRSLSQLREKQSRDNAQALVHR